MPGRFARVAAAMAVVALVAAACGSGSTSGKKGGSIVLGAEQWPECLNTVTSCANASWLGWSITNYVLPQAMEFDEKGAFIASPLLVEAPTIENGGIVEGPPFTVTFKIKPEAVWDDGTPITSADFEFTWMARVKTTGTLTTAGYEQIDSVDTSDPKTAVIKFKKPYADWPDLFGGNQHYVLKKAAFGGKVDLKDDMLDNISFSGGPWKLAKWTKQEAVLVRNEAYWDEDRKPLLDQVTFVPREDQDTEITALKTGEVVAIFPQPAPGFADKVKADNTDFEVGAGVVFEGLWFNLERDPVKDKAVREALFHAVDRKAIVDTVIAQIVPGVQVLNCGGWVPTVGEWCDSTDFADITYDVEKSKQILTDAGWTLGGDGIFTKGGKRLSIEWNTVAGNKRREDTQQLVKEQAKKAGIELTIKNFDAGELFENRLPKKDYTMAEYAQVASPDPSVTTIYGCNNIPTAANGFAGQNSIAWCNPQADAVMKQSDQTVDPVKRLELIRQVGDFVRSDAVWLPLYQLPNITAWRTDKLDGPIGTFTSSPPGGFWNIYDWSVK